MDNKDVEGFFGWLVDFVGDAGGWLVDFLEMIPDVVKGGILFALFLMWVWRKVNG